LQGEVYCEVKPDSNHPFLVTSRYSQTQVLGTHFAVRTGADADTVTVAEGKVRLAHEDEAVLLQVGEQASAYADHLSGRAKVSAERHLAWVRGSLVFEQTPLAEAVARIQQYRKGWVWWRNPALRDFPVSGRFNLANPDHIFDTLTRTLPVKITRVTPWLVVIG
jgi:transmembrane sensor